MGQHVFHVPNANSWDTTFWDSCYVTGIEGIPWAGRVFADQSGFRLERDIHESGKVTILWPTQECGIVSLNTASLRSQPDPYFLPLELARGTLHRVRSRAFEWQRIGLKLPDAFCQGAEKSLEKFLDGLLTGDLAKRSTCSQESIEQILGASRSLAESFIQQSLAARQIQEPKLSTLLGVKLEAHADWKAQAELALPAMNMASIALEWGKIEADSGRTNYQVFDEQIEWAKRNNLRVSGGPIISLQPHSMPQWIYLLNDFDTLLDAACEFVRKTVLRYKGKVNLWSAAAGLNTPNDLGLSDDQVLRLAVGIIQTVRRTDDRTPVVMHVDMPWAEYLGRNSRAISPLHFADALNRADLGLSGLGLDINLGYTPGGSYPRDLIDASDMIDHWSMLGLPLVATITTPLPKVEDPLANPRMKIVSNWKHGLPFETTQIPSAARGIDLLRLLLAKPNVHAIIWGQMSDRFPHPFPQSGLLDSQGKMTPELEFLIRTRQQYVH